MNRRLILAFMSTTLAAGLACLPMPGQTAVPISVPTAPPPTASVHDFRDSKFGVRFRIPPGWEFARKDGQVSTFRLDARSAVHRSQMRAVAAIDFNPYPFSTLSGALFYFSVEKHSTDAECERQATGPPAGEPRNDIQNIGGMDFTHGHDEHGQICVEARDEVYTAYRKGACYRFDLTVNTFCSISSGALDLTDGQMRDVEQRMTTILSTVVLDWEKTGPVPVPVPSLDTPEKQPGRTPLPAQRQPLPAGVGVGS